MRRDIPQGWRILEISARDDYYEYWNDIRRQSPVHDAGDGLFVVSGWEPAHAGLRHPELYAGSGVAAAFGFDSAVEAVVRNWLMSLNGDDHRRARALVARVFTLRAVAALEHKIRAITRDIMREFVQQAQQAPANFSRIAATRLPCEMIRTMFAIDPAEWTAQVEPLFLGAAGSQDHAFAAVSGLTTYFHQTIGNPGTCDPDGIIALLRAAGSDGDRLSEAEVIANCVLIVTAAVDTTAGLIANALVRLIEHPEILARVRANPALIPAVIEETLRHCPSAPSSSRHAATTVELGGVTIPQGSDIFFSISAANRDPERFAHPDRFDIDRQETGALTFGGGAHFCLGAGLARLEARVALEEILAITNTITLAEPVQWRTDNPVVRAPANLMITCS
ncbi:putative cytochrome P450 [Caenibius tardaugens NBRC 16725]|uniref:Putative cytochrome P450 n=1 Tax=Caenibius tardaugens NBRC 16725 TaxID=1219035 RepID=U2YP59_9SPHN|nr:cytochrome P450 [Caenibius tardaugens]GAD50407.1 putative cytochrome P450 [Caenibius tardaugens NBRC 16725]